MFEGRLRAAGKAIGLVTLAALQACAHGVEVPEEDEPREARKADAGGHDRDDDDADELDAGSSDNVPSEPEPYDVGSSVAKDAGAALDAGRDAGDDADLNSDAGAPSADAAVADAGASDAGAPYSCPSCMLKVQWNTSTTSASSQSIAGYLKLTNLGSTAIALSGVTVRYFLREAQAESMVVECYHWDDGKGVNKCTRPNGATGNTYTNLTVRVGSGAGDLRYIELGFPASAGELAPGGTAPGALQLAFHLPNYAALMQSDDPSFDATLSAAATGMLFDAPKICAYLGGKLSWGSEP